MTEPRLAFLGIGHPLRRDDAAGLEVCERLRRALAGRRDVLVVSGGPAPENCVGALRAFQTDVVLVFDAANMGLAPGAVRRVDLEASTTLLASTHGLPLATFCSYIASSIGCEVVLLGIEPEDTSFGEGLTPAVAQAVEHVVTDVLTQFRPASPTPSLPLASIDVAGLFSTQDEGVRTPRGSRPPVQASGSTGVQTHPAGKERRR